MSGEALFASGLTVDVVSISDSSGKLSALEHLDFDVGVPAKIDKHCDISIISKAYLLDAYFVGMNTYHWRMLASEYFELSAHLRQNFLIVSIYEDPMDYQGLRV